MEVEPPRSALATAMFEIRKQHLRPRAIVGFGIKIFVPRPLHYVTRSPGYILGFHSTSSYSKIKITFPSEVSVPSDKRHCRTLTFHNVFARQGSSFCNRARLNFQAFALRNTKVAAQEGCWVGQKMSYRFGLC